MASPGAFGAVWHWVVLQAPFRGVQAGIDGSPHEEGVFGYQKATQACEIAGKFWNLKSLSDCITELK